MKHAQTHFAISSASATELVAHAVSHAAENGWAVCVVVVDPSGDLVSAVRMDGVSVPIFEFANDKAYTAATLRKSTQTFYEQMSRSPALALGVSNRSRVCTWDGGVPIMEDGKVIGGLGVSGAAGHEDLQCAEYALAKMGLK